MHLSFFLLRHMLFSRWSAFWLFSLVFVALRILQSVHFEIFFLRCCLLHKGNHLYNTIKEHCALQKRFYGDFSLSIAWSHNVTPGKMSNFNYCIHGVVFFWEIQCRIFMALVIETMIRVRHLHNYLYVKKYLELIQRWSANWFHQLIFH